MERPVVTATEPQRTVRIDASGSVALAAQQAVASLPVSFRLTAGVAEVVVKDSVPSDDDLRGQTLVLVSLDDVETLRAIRLATAAGTPVVLASQWSSNPAMRAATTLAAETDRYRLESRLIWSGETSARQTLFEQVGVAERLLGPIDALHVAHWGPFGYVAAGRAAAVRFALSAVRVEGQEEELEVIVFTADGDITVAVPSWMTTQPGTLTHTTATGRTQLPAEWETGMRVALRTPVRLSLSQSDALLAAERRHLLIEAAVAGRRPDVSAT